MIRVAEWNREWNRIWFPTPWWRKLLSIPGYAAGWLGDHLINILIMVFVVLVATFMFPPL